MLLFVKHAFYRLLFQRLWHDISIQNMKCCWTLTEKLFFCSFDCMFWNSYALQVHNKCTPAQKAPLSVTFRSGVHLIYCTAGSEADSAPFNETFHECKGNQLGMLKQFLWIYLIFNVVLNHCLENVIIYYLFWLNNFLNTSVNFLSSHSEMLFRKPIPKAPKTIFFIYFCEYNSKNK